MSAGGAERAECHTRLTLPAALRCAGLRNVRVKLPSVSEICRKASREFIRL